MNIINKVKSVFIEPGNFFINLEEEKGLKSSIIYLWTLIPFAIIISIIIKYLSANSHYSLFFSDIVIYYFLFFLGTFILVPILHFCLKLLGGKASFSKTYQVFIYAITPKLLFGFVPVVNFFITTWAIVLEFVGFSKIHKINIWKVLLADILAFIFFMIVFVVFGTIFVSSIPSLKPAINNLHSLITEPNNISTNEQTNK
jgi:hypothetical protein